MAGHTPWAEIKMKHATALASDPARTRRFRREQRKVRIVYALWAPVRLLDRLLGTP